MAALQNQHTRCDEKQPAQLLGEWINGLEASGATRNLKEQDLQQQTSEFLQLVISGLRKRQRPEHRRAGLG